MEKAWETKLDANHTRIDAAITTSEGVIHVYDVGELVVAGHLQRFFRKES